MQWSEAWLGNFSMQSSLVFNHRDTIILPIKSFISDGLLDLSKRKYRNTCGELAGGYNIFSGRINICTVRRLGTWYHIQHIRTIGGIEHKYFSFDSRGSRMRAF